MTVALLPKLQNRWRYALDSVAVRPKTTSRVSPSALESAAHMRGADRPPTLFLHGVMPRSGSVYTGNLLKLNSHLHPYPKQIWEVPFLQQADKINAVQHGFEDAYQPAKGQLHAHDFLCLFGASFIGHMYRDVPQDKRMLLKMAGVHHLDRFFEAFPHEHLLVVMRDGRDVVRSTLNSWPSLGFVNVCRRWNQSAQLALAVEREFAGRNGFAMVRFEQILQDPAAFLRMASAEFDLPLDQTDFAAIDNLPVRGSSSVKKQGQVTWDAVSKPKNFNPVGGWQSWPTWKKTIFKQIAGKTLVELGYAENQRW